MILYTSLGRVVSIFFLCFFLIGFVHGNALMYMVGFFCLATILASSLVAWLAARGMTIERVVPGSTVFSSDPLETSIRLREVRGNWRLLEVFDESTNLITEQVTRRRVTVLLEGTHSNIAFIAGERRASLRPGETGRMTEMPDTVRFPVAATIASVHLSSTATTPSD